MSFTLDQPAATCWFHPHQHGKTGYQVSQGLAGLVLLEDEASSKLRLRLLNGCNARSLHIAASDKRLLYLVASDGGLLGEPVKVESLLLLGERFEVLVDTSDGKTFDIVTLPDQLVDVPPLPSMEGLQSRWLPLMMDPQLDQQGAGKPMDHGSMNMDYGAMDHGDMAMDHGSHASSAGYDFHNGNKING